MRKDEALVAQRMGEKDCIVELIVILQENYEKTTKLMVASSFIGIVPFAFALLRFNKAAGCPYGFLGIFGYQMANIAAGRFERRASEIQFQMEKLKQNVKTIDTILNGCEDIDEFSGTASTTLNVTKACGMLSLFPVENVEEAVAKIEDASQLGKMWSGFNSEQWDKIEGVFLWIKDLPHRS